MPVTADLDLGALKRGRTQPGETCQIPGLAPVPVALVRQILGDSLLELVITEGKDVRTVCTNSRHIRRALRVALEERDQTCCVPECEMADPLEIDHRTDFAKGGVTSLENLARLCPYHHHLKTNRGWTLEGRAGNWRFVRPDPPPGSGHPQHLEQPNHGEEDAAPRNGSARTDRTDNEVAGYRPTAEGGPSGRPDHRVRASCSEGRRRHARPGRGSASLGRSVRARARDFGTPGHAEVRHPRERTRGERVPALWDASRFPGEVAGFHRQAHRRCHGRRIVRPVDS